MALRNFYVDAIGPNKVPLPTIDVTKDVGGGRYGVKNAKVSDLIVDALTAADDPNTPGKVRATKWKLSCKMATTQGEEDWTAEELRLIKEWSGKNLAPVGVGLVWDILGEDFTKELG